MKFHKLSTVEYFLFFLVKSRESLDVGDVVAVYAEQSHSEKFWLCKVVELGKKNVRVLWMNKTGERRYVIGKADAIFYKNIIRSSKNGKSIFVFHLLKEQNCEYEFSDDALKVVEGLC